MRSALSLSLALCASGCPSSSTEKAEAAAVSRAVDSLRDADNEKKHELLGALRAAPCSAADVCAVRSQCLAAYELLVGTLDRARDVARERDGGQGAVSTLDALKTDLTRAQDLGAKCTDAQGEMIRRYKL